YCLIFVIMCVYFLYVLFMFMYFFYFLFFFYFFFFFQAEDGIRDLTVTGVQTCALPILMHARQNVWLSAVRIGCGSWMPRVRIFRSEERRVGKECRSRWAADH